MRWGSVGELFSTRINNFHLLRLLAALAVIYGHSYPIVGSGGGDIYLQLVGNKFIGGLAVDIFFVASGFLVASSLERGSLKRYLWARSLRIFPALMVACGLTVFLLGPLLTVNNDYWSDAQTWRYLVNNALMIRTEYFLPGVFAGNSDPAVNGSLWSLPIEFRLYLVFFALAFFGLLQRERFTVLSIALLLAGLVIVPRCPVFTQYANWVNCTFLFFAGALVWKRRDEVQLSPWGVFGLIALAMMTHGTPAFTVAYSLALVYFVFVFALCMHLPEIRSRDISYGVYLYGWPVQQLLAQLLPSGSAVSNAVLASVIVCVLAVASWELVEKPMLSLKNRVK